MNYLVQLLLVGTNFTLHLFFPFFCGILRLKWVSLSSMMPCCVTTLCYSEEGCAGGLLVSALLMFMSLWIYLRISETGKSSSLAKNVMTPLLGPWTLKGGCITGYRWSGSQLWVAVLYGCDLDAYSTFIPGGTRVLRGCIISPPCEALQSLLKPRRVHKAERVCIPWWVVGGGKRQSWLWAPWWLSVSAGRAWGPAGARAPLPRGLLQTFSESRTSTQLAGRGLGYASSCLGLSCVYLPHD